ncbi:MAG TPA: mechanosensitive ion channel domain-containing protein [Puia sp.]|nr:mechanosensitive ion channel domain-containing protein [Puia sp.]
MNDFWNQVFFSNPIKKYAFVLGAILLALIIKRFISKIIARVLFGLIKRTGTDIDKASFVKLLTAPLETFLLVFIIIASLDKLHFPTELDFDIYEVTSKKIVHAIAATIMICLFIWLLLRLLDFVALLIKQKAKAAGDIKEHQLIIFFRDFFKVIISIIGILMILNFAFEFDVTKLWTGLGIAGAALALAAKESVENLIASFIIFFDKPFTAGDVVKVNGITGNIERIGLRSTRVRTDQKTYVTIPNKQMVDSIVDNLSLRTQRKAEIRLEISLLTSSDTLNELIDSLKKIVTKNLIESFSVFLNDITSRSFLINVDYFTSTISQDDFNDLKEQVNLEILSLMEKLKIEVAGANADVRVSNNPANR